MTQPHTPINQSLVKSPEKCQPALAEQWALNTDWKMRPYKVRSLGSGSNSIYMKKDRNGPLSANQVVSTAEFRCGHAVCTL